MSVHFSSASDEWATPQHIFDALHAEFCFDLDPCATAENAKCAKFFTREQDGLLQQWGGGESFYEPAIWPRDLSMDEEGLGKRLRWRFGGVLGSSPDRYTMVARLCHARRDPFHQGPTQIRQQQEFCAIPERHRHIQAEV